MASGGQRGAAFRPKRSRPVFLASDHRHRGAKAALQLFGQLMGTGHGHGAELAHGLVAAAHKDGAALWAIGLDAVRNKPRKPYPREYNQTFAEQHAHS